MPYFFHSDFFYKFNLLSKIHPEMSILQQVLPEFIYLNTELVNPGTLDGLSILFIILSTSNNFLCLSSTSINIEKNYFSFIIYNRICCNQCFFSYRYFL
jgi:hypothetical protein